MITPLSELDVKWTSSGAGRTGMGVVFNCPIHGESCKIHISIANPIDDGCTYTPYPGLCFWTRVGDLSNLTLDPSIKAPHLHAIIANGMLHWPIAD